MFFRPIALALTATIASASPLLAAPEAAEGNDTLDARQVLTTDLYAVYNTEKWQTTIAPGTGASDGGEEVYLSAGFNIVTNQGQILFSTSDADGYGLCVQGGQVIEVSGGCFPTPFRFSCAPNFSGDAGSCAVWGPDPDGAPTEVQDCEDANSGVDYYAFAAGSSGQCVMGFTTYGDCNPDNFQYPYTYEKVEMQAPPCNECPSCS